MVQLLGRVLLLWRDAIIYLLPSHLFSGCERCLANLERGLSSPKHLKPDPVLGLVWLLRYVGHPPATFFWRYQKHWLTGISVKNRLLLALGCFWGNFDLGRIRLDVDPNADIVNWNLGRLSDSKRDWTWLWTSDSKFGS